MQTTSDLRCCCRPRHSVLAAVLVAAVFGLGAGCGGEGDGPDAGGSPDAPVVADAGPGVTPDASFVASNLVDELIIAGAASQAFRESSQWNFEFNDGWLVRLERFTPPAQPGGDYQGRTSLYADDPGSSTLDPGQEACYIEATVQVHTVPDFDPFDRVRLVSELNINTCTGVTGVSLEHVLEVVERDGQDRPTLIAKWQLLGIEEGDPAPDWIWVDMGKATPWRPCREQDHGAGRDYCAVDCDWDYIFEPMGDGCIQ